MSAAGPAEPGAIRPLVLADVPAIAALEHELFERSAWTETMIREELWAQGRYYVALDDADGLVGYAGSWFDGDVSQVMTIGVAHRAQRRGLGRALLRALLDHARGLGAPGGVPRGAGGQRAGARRCTATRASRS